MTPITRRLRETSVVIVDPHIPDGMTIAEYRRSRSRRERATRRRRLRLGAKVRASVSV